MHTVVIHTCARHAICVLFLSEAHVARMTSISDSNGAQIRANREERWRTYLLPNPASFQPNVLPTLLDPHRLHRYTLTQKSRINSYPGNIPTNRLYNTGIKAAQDLASRCQAAYNSPTNLHPARGQVCLQVEACTEKRTLSCGLRLFGVRHSGYSQARKKKTQKKTEA